jgi:hypothetical protein
LLLNKDSKLKSVEVTLTSRCNELEMELNKMRSHYPQTHQIDTEPESPFEPGDLETICQSPMHDEST